MKTLKAMAVAVLGMALAGEAWGSLWGFIRFNVDPSDPLRCEVEYRVPDISVMEPPSGGRGPNTVPPERIVFHVSSGPSGGTHHTGAIDITRAARSATRTCPRLQWDTHYVTQIYALGNGGDFTETAEYKTPPQTPREPPSPPEWLGVRFNVDPNDPLRCEVEYSLPENLPGRFQFPLTLRIDRHHGYKSTNHLPNRPITRTTRRAIVACSRMAWDSRYEAAVWGPDGYGQISGPYRGARRTTPPEPEPPAPPPEPEPPPSPPEPEPPAPPPEPEPPAPPPEPEPPEPEVPDPEEPDHTHPVERCDHIAIVPAMPRALSGDEGSPDHWLRISNLGAASITFTVTGLDEGGTKAGTYRRELPASRIVRVKMRDVEAAFDVEPEGWWRLVVTGSGPLEVVATMRQGAERRFVPVRTPATCTSGPVTRAGG